MVISNEFNAPGHIFDEDVSSAQQLVRRGVNPCQA